MTFFSTMFSSRAATAMLTLVFSATMVLSAVAPAYVAPGADRTVTAGLANVPSESATSLA